MSIYDYILNKNTGQQFYTGTVITLNPLTVKLFDDDTAIPVVSTSNLTGTIIGSKLIFTKIGNQFFAIGIINDYVANPQYIRKINSQDFSNTSYTDSTNMVVTIPGDGNYYSVDVWIVAWSSSATPQIKVAWTASGGAYENTSYRICTGFDGDGAADASGRIQKSGVYLITDGVRYPVNDTTPDESVIKEHFVVKCTTSTAAVFQMTAGQYTSSGTNVTMSGASHIIRTKLYE